MNNKNEITLTGIATPTFGITIKNENISINNVLFKNVDIKFSYSLAKKLGKEFYDYFYNGGYEEKQKNLRKELGFNNEN